MKPYITKKEVEETQGKDARTQRFLTAENGCLGGCTSGTTIYAGSPSSCRMLYMPLISANITNELMMELPP